MVKKKDTNKINKPLNVFVEGGNLSTMRDIGNIGSSAISILGAGLNNAQITDTSDLDSTIKAANNYIVSANTNDDLMSEWQSFNPLNEISWRDIRGGNTSNMLGNTLGSVATGIGTETSFGGPVGAIIGGVAGLGSAIGGWISGNRKAKNQAKRINKQIDMANSRKLLSLDNRANNISTQNYFDSLANFAAYGGGLEVDDNFSNGLSFIDNGGTHEENPFGGIQIGIDKEGIPNLVEEGETIFNNYVFSNRLLVPEEFKDKNKLGKKDITFAEASEKFAKESAERPNDPISKRGLLNFMTKLQIAQEGVKYEEEVNNSNNKIKDISKNMFAEGGPFNSWGYDPMKQFKYWNTSTNSYDQGYMNFVNTMSPEVFKDIYSGKYGSMDRYNKANPNNIPTLEEGRQLALDGKYSDYHKAVASAYEASKVNPQLVDRAKQVNPIAASLFTQPHISSTIDPNINIAPNYKFSNLTWLRYAPAVGTGLGAISDIAGLTNKPDYTNADMIGNLGVNAPKVSPEYIGNYLTYRPLDREFYINQMNAQSGASRRALVNQSGGNRATAMAGLLASDYNAQNALGNLARQAEEYNLGQRERVEGFNRGTNQFNAEATMRADMANQQADMNASQMKFRAKVMEAQMRDQIEARANQSRMINLSNFFDSLGDIGREEFSRNMVMSNPANYYWLDRNGNTHYKRQFYDLPKDKQEEIKKEAENSKSKTTKSK